MSVGALAYLGLTKEAAFATPVTATHFPPISSESFRDGPEAISEAQIRGLLSMDPKYKGMQMVSGGFGGVAYPSTLGHLFRAAFGNPVTTGAGPYTHTFIPPQAAAGVGKADMPPYSITVNRNAVQIKRYFGLVLGKLGLKFTQGGMLTYDTTWLGKDADVVTAPTLVQNTDTPFQLTANLTRGGSPDITIQDFSIDITNSFEAVKTINNTNLIEAIRLSGKRTITFSGTADFSSTALYDQFVAYTTQAWSIVFTQGPATLTIEIPAALLPDVSAAVGGDGRITASFSGEAQYDTATSRDLRMILINSIAAY